jgi:hypothetical protein
MLAPRVARQIQGQIFRPIVLGRTCRQIEAELARQTSLCLGTSKAAANGDGPERTHRLRIGEIVVDESMDVARRRLGPPRAINGEGKSKPHVWWTARECARCPARRGSEQNGGRVGDICGGRYKTLANLVH